MDFFITPMACTYMQFIDDSENSFSISELLETDTIHIVMEPIANIDPMCSQSIHLTKDQIIRLRNWLNDEAKRLD